MSNKRGVITGRHCIYYVITFNDLNKDECNNFLTNLEVACGIVECVVLA